MRLPWILLPILVQGALGDVFRIIPEAEQVVHKGTEVTLECVTKQDAQLCAWKMEVPKLAPTTGFLTSDVPTGIGITAKDPNSKRDCSIVISSTEDRHNGTYICAPYVDGSQREANDAHVIIARKPDSFEYQGAQPLVVSRGAAVTATCQASGAQPKARIDWYLDNEQLYGNSRTGTTIEVTDTIDGSDLWTTVSTLTSAFSKEDNGKELRCRASHKGYDESDQAQRERATDIDVLFAAYRPGGNKMGRLYGFTAGQKGEVTVNFTANPLPQASWMIGKTSVPVPGTSINNRFTSGGIDIEDAPHGMYSITLTIHTVEMEDQQKSFVLRLKNDEGTSQLEFQIGTGARPPPSGLSSAAIGGIVAAVIILLIVVALVAFGRSRGKWCFAAKTSEARSDRSDTESAHDEKTDKPEKKPVKISTLFSSLLKGNKADADVEMAENKDETRELTKPDGEADGDAPPPPKKEGEVVYAELMLNSDGVKTEVRPSADKTEYAVIVGTKQEAENAEDNKTKE